MNNIDENKLEHSNEALNITHQFYDKKFMLYVEGDDDVEYRRCGNADHHVFLVAEVSAQTAVDELAEGIAPEQRG